MGQKYCSFESHLPSKSELKSSHLPKTHNKRSRGDRSDMLYVNIKFHIVNSGIDDYLVTTPPSSDLLDSVNALFLPHDIQFVHCGEYLQYDNFDIATDSWEADDQKLLYRVDEAINVFFTGGGGPSYASITYNDVHIKGTKSPTVVAHEIGHILTLLHTHSELYGEEFVDGTNCGTQGDLVCDTPADPDLSLPDMVDDCTYIGTGTDSNGDSYMPNVNNIMSYSPEKCMPLFSDGQGERMYDALMTTNWDLLIHPVNQSIFIDEGYTFCSNDEGTYSLVGYPEGGVFSGPGVDGNTFSPEGLTDGLTMITYDPAIDLDSIDFVSQSFSPRLMYYDLGIYPYLFDTLTSMWQAVEIENNCRILNYRQLVKLEEESTLTLSVYSGIGLGGDLLYTTTVVGEAGGELQWIDFSIDAALTAEIGDFVTFQITSDNDMIVGRGSSGTAYYAFGDSNWGSFYSHFFGVTVRAINPCDNITYAYVKINEPIPGTIEGLNDSYCSGRDSLLLNGIPEGGVFSVDGEEAEYLYPKLLTPGAHLVSYESTDINGCFNEVNQTVTIEAFDVTFLEDLGPYCHTDGTQAHNGSPFGGDFYVDGVSTDSIYLDDLSLGTHEAAYVYQELSDTTYLLDQSKEYTGLDLELPFPTMYQDTTYWQSFTAEKEGILDRFQLISYYWENQEFELSLYEGEGITGDLLMIDTTLFTTSTSGEFQDFLVPETDILMVPGNNYTVAFRWLDGPETPPIFLALSNNNAYENGTSNFDSTDVELYDFHFKEYIRNYHDCHDSTVVEFEIIDCTIGFAENAQPKLILYPNPSIDIVKLDANVLLDEITVYNSLGQVVYMNTSSQKNYEIPHLIPGYYILEAKYDGQKIHEPLIME